jgi:hypothetical protein
MTVFELPLSPVRSEKIPNTRPPANNRVTQHFLHNPVEIFKLRPAQPADRLVRMQTRAEKDFIGINVADACNVLLMHEQGLQSAPTPPHQP